MNTHNGVMAPLFTSPISVMNTFMPYCHAVAAFNTLQVSEEKMAGRVWGVKTADQGRIRGRPYFLVLTRPSVQDGCNPGEKYVTLPKTDGVTWVTGEKHKNHFLDLCNKVWQPN